MGLIKDIFGGGEQSSSSTSKVEVPRWLDNRNKSLASRADSLSKRQFTPYTAQRIAEFTPDSLRAFDLTRQNTGQFNDLLSTTSNSVYDLISRAQGPSSADIQQRMNPFLDNILDISKRNTIQDYNTQQAQRDREAGLINAYGGSRVAIRQALADEQLAEDLTDLDYTGRFDAFENARNQFNQDTNVLAQGISQGLSTIGQGQQYNINDINQLLKSGELQRLREQDVLDFDYSEFDREQAYDYENVNFLANILNPLTGAYAGGTTTAKQDSGGSGLGQTVGAVASIASLFSDERVKENIQEVGELENGLKVYSYNYKGDPRTQIGLIAQEVEQEKPEAVAETEEGIKMVDYDQAVKLRDGGPVYTNRASAARLAPVNSAGRANLPSAPALPKESGSPGLDALGLKILAEKFNDSEYSFNKGDGNMLGRLFGNYGEQSYTAPIGPTMTPDSSGFFGLDGADTGNFLSSIMSSIGFAEGGPVKEKDYNQELIRSLFQNTPQYPIDPDTQSKAGIAGRRILNTINTIPAMAASIPLNIQGGADLAVDKASEVVSPIFKDLFFKSSAQVDTEGQQRKQEKKTRKAELAQLNQDIAAKYGSQPDVRQVIAEQAQKKPINPNGPLTVANLDPNAVSTQIPAISTSELGMSSPVSLLPSTQRAQNLSASMQLPEWLLPQASIQPETQIVAEKPKEEANSSGVNIPLLLAGLTMLGTDGSFGNQLLAGLGAATQYMGDERRAELEKQKLEQEAAQAQAEAQYKQRQDAIRNYLDYLKAQAYMEQVTQNAQKAGTLSPAKAAELQLKREKLALDREKFERENPVKIESLEQVEDALSVDEDAANDILSNLSDFFN